MDFECSAASTEVLVETYARQVLDEKLDIVGSDKVADACEIVIRALDGLQAESG